MDWFWVNGIYDKNLAPFVLQGSSCGGVRAMEPATRAGYGRTILLAARTLAYLVDDKESYAGPYDTECNNAHDLHPGIRVSCEFVMCCLVPLLLRREKKKNLPTGSSTPSGQWPVSCCTCLRFLPRRERKTPVSKFHFPRVRQERDAQSRGRKGGGRAN